MPLGSAAEIDKMRRETGLIDEYISIRKKISMSKKEKKLPENCPVWFDGTHLSEPL